MAGPSMKVHQVIARSLIDNGVDTMFGLSGDANMFTIDSFVHEHGGVFVAAAHEAGATMMALGYAQLSGKVGICSVTHGPAMTNTVTGLVEGVKGSTPLVLICGDTRMEDRTHNQKAAQRDFAIAAGAGFEQLRSPKTAAEDVAMALRRAIVERRPIVLNVPFEFDWSDVEYQPVLLRIPENRALAADGEDLDNVVGVIAAARRPLILVGRGATSPEAKEAILRLARRIDAPLATTLKAKDLFRGDDFNLGVCGTLSTPGAVDTIMESDCLIAFGASLTHHTTSHRAFLNGKRVVQISREPADVGKNVLPDVGVVGDPAGVADRITHWLNEAEIPSSGWCDDALKERIAADRPQLPAEPYYSNGTVDFPTALSRLEPLLPSDRVLVTDGGRFLYAATQILSSTGPDAFLAAINFGSIGLGFSHAIGAAFAKPGRPVVAIVGDGGFMLGGLVEFNTAIRYKLDLIVVVCNDGAYGSEVSKYRERRTDRQPDPGVITFEWPDLATLAAAFGGVGVTVRAQDDWRRVEEAIQSPARPLLIDLKLDWERVTH